MADPNTSSPFSQLFAQPHKRPTFHQLATTCGFSDPILHGEFPASLESNAGWGELWREYRRSNAFKSLDDDTIHLQFAYVVFQTSVARAFFRGSLGSFAGGHVSQTSEFRIARTAGELEALEATVVELARVYSEGAEPRFQVLWNTVLLGSSLVGQSLESLLHSLAEREPSLRSKMLEIHQCYRGYVVDDFGFRERFPALFGGGALNVAGTVGLD